MNKKVIWIKNSIIGLRYDMKNEKQTEVGKKYEN